MVKRKTKSFIALIVLIAIIGVAILQFSGLKDFDLSDANVTKISFASSNNTLQGSLVLPKNVTAPPIALIVHGDGAQTRFENSNYLPLVNSLLKDGIGVFSWDKPGVGQSTGAWLQQSMSDRSDEVRAAYNKIHSLPALKNSPIGFLGFSQAGWVLPITDNEMKPAFTVIVGGAVSWRHQGAYYTKRQLEDQGLSPEQVSQKVAANLKNNDETFGNPNTATPGMRPKMNPDRFDFVVRNYNSDASPYLGSMQGPVLALWGADDKNVDPLYNQAIYKQKLHPDQEQVTAIIKHATHGLLKAQWFNYQLPSEWPLWRKGLFILMGRDAYAPRALDTIGMWINKVTHQQAN
ncbi:Alpha/beta hydrolase family protein [Marinomonas spartinae]|uniref:alpha/beta hydrolase family protein n=1 Tax=Marinomonas spartinae TaxID=1792290 RepID=UPI000808D791|nr:alpha/beta hydrolase [Marinomonas spartinae]SBS29989.1 Alpha/beta hydrolase family protein [Marinomonas spartinae]